MKEAQRLKDRCKDLAREAKKVPPNPQDEGCRARVDPCLIGR